MDNLAFDRPHQRVLLNHRNIFQIGPPTLPSVLVVGDVENNASKVCCEAVVDRKSKESCTTLVLYGKNYSRIGISKGFEILIIVVSGTGHYF